MKSLKFTALFLSCALAVSASAVMVSAEDFEADVSSAVKSSDWGQTYKLYFDAFDFSSLTEDSEVYVEYTVKTDESITESPVELIVQSWDEYDDETGEVLGDGEIWGKTAPKEYDDHSAVFTYEDMLAAYKAAAKNPDNISDLSGVLCLNIGSTNQGEILCTSLKITNVGEGSGNKNDDKTGINVLINAENPTETSSADEIMRVTADDFDATRINANTKLVIHYTKMDTKPAFCPVNVVLISENNTTVPDENKIDADGNVNQKLTLPESYDEEKVVFNCKQILDAYGTGNFTELTDFSIVGTSQRVTVESVEFTDVNQFGTRSTLTSSQEEDKGTSPVLIVAIIVLAVIIVAVVFFFVIKSKSGKTYDVSSGKYVDNDKKE